jgi:hypothetical protein
VSVKTQEVIDAVTDVTKDYDRVRFLLPEISRWMNHGARQIATIDDRAASQYLTLTLGAGVRQDLRTIDATKSWVRLHEVVCNVAVDGTPNGDTIRKVVRSGLDSAFKRWRASASASTIKEYSQDEREPFTFDVFPPAVAGTKVLGLASVRPGAFCVLNVGGTALANANELVPLADGFEVPLIDYTLFRLFSKDANDPTYVARAAMHLQAFQMSMAIEAKDAKAE